MSDLSKMTAKDIERFWSKVAVSHNNMCWNWKDTLNRDGYGSFQFGGRSGFKRRAHRVALALWNGHDVPENKFVLHDCDNPACCNPMHLRVGTHQQNMDDMVEKERSPVSFGHAKLNWDIVDDIRASSEHGTVLAAKYGVSKATISGIRTRKTWCEEHRHVATGLS